MKKTRGVLIAGNWKMNLTAPECEQYLRAFKPPQSPGLTVRIFVPAPYLSLAHKTAQQGVQIGAQNAHGEVKGAFTGETSATMLASLGIEDALIGHSERRHVFHETDELIRARTHGLLAQGIRVMLCIGETRAEREAQQTDARLTAQLDAVFSAGFEPSWLPRLTLAYEPVWAIGTGLTATPAQAEETHKFIRKYLWDKLGMDASARTPLLYGGSVTPENAAELLKCANIDGLLVGGASLKSESFGAILTAAKTLL
jgi:triosephosphate isomerase